MEAELDSQTHESSRPVTKKSKKSKREKEKMEEDSHLPINGKPSRMPKLKLEPKIRGLDNADKQPSVLGNVELSQAEGSQAKGAPIRYGSKKPVNQAEKMQVLKQGDDPESQGLLGKDIGIAPVNKLALESTNSHVALNIPPCNSSDEAEKKTLSSIFSYITHLIKFKDLHSLDGASSTKKHRFPSIIRMRFMEMFVPEARKLALEKNNLLISYVLSNLADIAMDLTMSPVTLRAHFEKIWGVNL
ncbi:hypothetical protein K2173_014931 [Erythroxylum novogranatense]|uniref:Uncharacterized protein n=1 Tax=Erythroxylum novogranatense TaxID=1862640 RepID=A0AAV8TTM8_9ROSI|nr:hypothetical protein K2173_014931 [Erythroxylum novogranatense]